MARNRSEKLPAEAPGIPADFYKLLRIYAAAHVLEGTSAQLVRDAVVNWGKHNTEEVYALFGTWTHRKKTHWYDWSDGTKRAYVAAYMDYFYGSQSK